MTVDSQEHNANIDESWHLREHGISPVGPQQNNSSIKSIKQALFKWTFLIFYYNKRRNTR